MLEVHVVLGVGQLDPCCQVDPAGARTRRRLIGTGAGDPAPQVALAGPGQGLAEGVARAADARRQEVGAGIEALVGDVAQFGAQHRIGQGAGRLDAGRSRLGLDPQCRELGMPVPGELQQALDTTADQHLGFRRMRRPCREQERREQDRKRAHGPTSPLRC
jgi:hypothetical protein